MADGNAASKRIFIGLMSGTSLDGIDAVAVSFQNALPTLLGAVTTRFPADIQQSLQGLCIPGDNEIERMGEMDIVLAHEFARAVKDLLSQSGLTTKDITAIGNHGQTVRHRPNQKFPFTLQIGDPSVLAELTGIVTVADFRRADMAAGGQGAPLVPAYHAHLFQDEEIDRVIVNIGGIANLTWLPALCKSDKLLGYDTGPGNILMNLWIQEQLNRAYDDRGQLAASGNINAPLLQACITDPFFQLSPPKSTGREYFNLDWLKRKLDVLGSTLSSSDVQATLCELSARTIADSIKKSAPTVNEIYICGGGVHNTHLVDRIKELIPDVLIDSTEALGTNPDYVEAITFAWLAQQTLVRRPGNLPEVTGAARGKILGGIYFP